MSQDGGDRPDRAQVSVPRTAAPGHAPPEPRREPGDLVPALLLAVPMALAFLLAWNRPEGMLAWALSRAGLAAGEIAPLALHMFAHGGLVHLGFNLVALFALAPAALDRLGGSGPRALAAFLALFFATGLAGAALYLAFPHTAPMLGASGAIFGLLGFVLRQPDPDGPPIALAGRAMGQAFWTFVKLHIPLLLIFAIPLLLGAPGFGLAWEAHLGGFIAGLLLHGPIRRMAGAR